MAEEEEEEDRFFVVLLTYGMVPYHTIAVVVHTIPPTHILFTSASASSYYHVCY